MGDLLMDLVPWGYQILLGIEKYVQFNIRIIKK